MMSNTKENKSRFNNLLKCCAMTALSILMMAAFAPHFALAASATVTFGISSEEVRVGDPVSITMTVTADVVPGTVSAYISYDPSLLEYVTGPVGVAGGEGMLKLTDSEIGNSNTTRKYTFVFLASKMGSATVALSRPPQITDESEGDLMSVMTDQITFEILQSLKASSDATLSALKCSPGTLQPEFNAQITEYSTMVEADTDELIVSAFANDAFAKVSVSGNTDLIPGQNRVVVTVTAEDGSELRYVIYALKPQPEGGDIRPSGADPVDTASSQKLPETDPVLSGPIHAFYVVEEDLKRVLVSDTYYTVVDDGSGVTVPEGYTKTAVKISGFTITAYAPNGSSDPSYVLLVLKKDDGAPGLYVYDRSEKTVQRYDLVPRTVVDTAPVVTRDDSAALKTSLQKAETSLGRLTVVVIVLGILLLLACLVVVRTVTVIGRLKHRRER